ncbi:hypothetical protein C8F04DRAFT_1198904 [Mycena alexandri]|uniref:Uncharacterized protein n=1 Tax=Mycena alexandri TaxID=1745969 RepID=A0AAD6S264_9AGAR|nr:hypothetical protein C8F04DRAFT_1198904 [Mycena alexandri]
MVDLRLKELVAKIQWFRVRIDNRERLPNVVLALKAGLDVLLVITHLVSAFYVLESDIPDPLKNDWMYDGVPLIVANAICTVIAMKYAPDSAPREKTILVGGVCRAVGNIFHTGVTGVWEFALDGKKGWDGLRFTGDVLEISGAIADLAANVFVFWGQPEEAAGCLMFDLLDNIAGIVVDATLLGVYMHDPDSLAETGSNRMRSPGFRPRPGAAHARPSLAARYSLGGASPSSSRCASFPARSRALSHESDTTTECRVILNANKRRMIVGAEMRRTVKGSKTVKLRKMSTSSWRRNTLRKSIRVVTRLWRRDGGHAEEGLKTAGEFDG